MESRSIRVQPASPGSVGLSAGTGGRLLFSSSSASSKIKPPRSSRARLIISLGTLLLVGLAYAYYMFVFSTLDLQNQQQQQQVVGGSVAAALPSVAMAAASVAPSAPPKSPAERWRALWEGRNLAPGSSALFRFDGHPYDSREAFLAGLKRSLAQIPSLFEDGAPVDVAVVGSGAGSVAEALIGWNKKARVTGFEQDESLVALAKRRVPSATFVRADPATELRSYSGRFAVVIVDGLLLAVPKRAVKGVMGAVGQLVRPGGSLMVLDVLGQRGAPGDLERAKARVSLKRGAEAKEDPEPIPQEDLQGLLGGNMAVQFAKQDRPSWYNLFATTTTPSSSSSSSTVPVPVPSATKENKKKSTVIGKIAVGKSWAPRPSSRAAMTRFMKKVAARAKGARAAKGAASKTSRAGSLKTRLKRKLKRRLSKLARKKPKNQHIPKSQFPM